MSTREKKSPSATAAKKAPRKAKPKPVATEPAATVTASAPTPAPVPRPTLIEAPIAVRWRDLDAFNHVNNSTFLTYLEEARLQWLKQVPGSWFDEHSMPVLAASEVHYRRPITWPAQLVVQLHCTRLGTSSITIAHRIVDAADPATVYSDGHVVLVWVDPDSGKSTALPEAIRTAANGTEQAPIVALG